MLVFHRSNRSSAFQASRHFTDEHKRYDNRNGNGSIYKHHFNGILGNHNRGFRKQYSVHTDQQPTNILNKTDQCYENGSNKIACMSDDNDKRQNTSDCNSEQIHHDQQDHHQNQQLNKFNEG